MRSLHETQPTYSRFQWRQHFQRQENYKRIISTPRVTVPMNGFLKSYLQNRQSGGTRRNLGTSLLT